MAPSRPIPLDLRATEYSYVERPNSVLVDVVRRLVIGDKTTPRILDIGCGAGANARALKEISPHAVIVGVEPNARAAELALEVCDRVLVGTADDWLVQGQERPFDGVILSDVLEHTPDPVDFLERLAAAPALQRACFVISVPNYAVWYNRVRTLVGRFEYSWSGLFDRTHLRFFTRRSLRELLGYCGFDLIEERVTPSLVQSAAPLLRKRFEKDVAAGAHLTLAESRAFRFYRRFVEPVETGVCRAWPGLLGFQLVCAAEKSWRAGTGA
jgi:SAM-dependent methyltransferase